MQTPPADTIALVSCVVAGLACGMLCTALSSILYKVADAFGRLPVHWLWWPALGGLVVGLGGWLEPRAPGVGYAVIVDMLGNDLALAVVGVLVLVTAVLWVVALVLGVSGGVHAPRLI